MLRRLKRLRYVLSLVSFLDRLHVLPDLVGLWCARLHLDG